MTDLSGNYSMLFVSELSGRHSLLPRIVMLKRNLLVVCKIKSNDSNVLNYHNFHWPVSFCL